VITKLRITQGSSVWAHYFAAYDPLAEDGADRKFLISVEFKSSSTEYTLSLP
jgi:hypothetical protein